MFQQIALFKLRDASANAETRAAAARSLREEMARRGYDATVGLPADAAAEKSWDLALVATFRTREQAQGFSPAEVAATSSGLSEGAIAVSKTWMFEV